MRSRKPLSRRCVQLLAVTALLDPTHLMAVAYALKNDAQLGAVKLAHRLLALPPDRLIQTAQRILAGEELVLGECDEGSSQ